MQCVANYEIKSELSVSDDGQWLKLTHPRGLYRARIRNIVRSDFSTPFLLSLHITFDAESLDDAREVAEERLADCLNILAFATGCSFKRHRIRAIVDCAPSAQMRSCLLWGDSIGHDDPEPFLDNRIANSIDRLMAFDAPPAIQKAMRWYRQGINASVPDDQFQYFWFALELVAEYQKSPEKVPSKCPRCTSPLFCETCQKHPVHKPYAKQAIRALIMAADKECSDVTIELLDTVRNSLMHGATLREIESKLPEPREEVIDVLGRIVFQALAHQFPPEMFKKEIVLGAPSTYIHRTVSGIAHVQTVVPLDADGELDLRFIGTQMKIVADAPPQSARPYLVGLTADQHKRLGRMAYQKGHHQEMCRRLFDRAKVDGEHLITVVPATDMARIREALRHGETGDWQDFFREIIDHVKSGHGN